MIVADQTAGYRPIAPFHWIHYTRRYAKDLRPEVAGIMVNHDYILGCPSCANAQERVAYERNHCGLPAPRVGLALQERLPVLQDCIWRGRTVAHRNGKEELLSVGSDVPE